MTENPYEAPASEGDSSSIRQDLDRPAPLWLERLSSVVILLGGPALLVFDYLKRGPDLLWWLLASTVGALVLLQVLDANDAPMWMRRICFAIGWALGLWILAVILLDIASL